MAREEAARRNGRNRKEKYKNDYEHPIGREHQHLIGCAAELSLAAGTGLQWSGQGQQGMKRIDVGHGEELSLEAKGTVYESSGLKLTKSDLRKEPESLIPYVLVQVCIFPEQICCYPVGWQWRSRIPTEGLARRGLRNFKELLDQLEGKGHGPYDEAIGTPQEVSRGERYRDPAGTQSKVRVRPMDGEEARSSELQW